MYTYGLKPKPHRRHWPIWVGLASFILILAGLIVIGLKYAKSNTTFSQSKAVITKVAATKTPYKKFTEAGFSLELPTDWKLESHLSSPYNLYHFHGTTKVTSARSLDVYKDTIPTNFMINRLQPIEGTGNKISVIGTVSENCADFTNGPSLPGKPGTAAKWQGVDFLCDLANYERNVVGTGSAGTLNSVNLKDSFGAQHKYFFVYTDNTISTDYNAFYNALNTFTID